MSGSRSLCRLKAFQSTLPVRGATPAFGGDSVVQRISIHAPRAGSDIKDMAYENATTAISIHAPRAGSDRHLGDITKINWDISIHAPRAGSDTMAFWPFFVPSIFQSTLPVRGATQKPPVMLKSEAEFQSTLPVRGATNSKGDTCVTIIISIHAPRAGSDYQRRTNKKWKQLFQSTLPVRGATVKIRIFIRIFK